LTFFLLRPLRSVPALRFFMARSTFFAEPLEYFRLEALLAIDISPNEAIAGLGTSVAVHISWLHG
jgi:hypothetical protein